MQFYQQTPFTHTIVDVDTIIKHTFKFNRQFFGTIGLLWIMLNNIVNTLKSTTTAQKIGAVILLILLSFGLLQPIFYPVDYAAQNLANILQAPSATHPFGTDQFGRDMVARIGAGIRLSFGMAIVAVAVSASLGLVLGIWAGFGGLADKVLGFVCDVIMALPGLLFILLFAAIAPNSFWSLYFGISLVMWVEFFKMSRAISQTLAKSAEVESSYLMGMGFWYALKRHFLPKLLPVMATLSAFAAGNAVLALATLGFVNVGLRPPTAELGLMMTELFPYYNEGFVIFIQPIVVVFLMVLGFQLISGKNDE